jgi:hypothetical protein
MKKSLHTFLLFISANCLAQSSCDCFDRLYLLANSDSTRYVEIMRDALSFLQPEQKSDYYWEIGDHFYQRKMYDSSVVYYTKAIEGGYSLENVRTSAWETYIRMDTTRMKKIALQYWEKADMELYDKFVSQSAIDQFIRNEEYFPYNEHDSCKQQFTSGLYKKVDHSTYEFLKWIFDTYGDPTFAQLGFFPSDITGMMLHVTAYENEDADSLFHELETLNNACNFVQKSKILFMKERQLYYNHRYSYCGLIGSGQRYLYIKDPAKTDSIRFQYNLLRLSDEAKLWNGTLPAGYQPSAYPKNYFCLKNYDTR